MGIPENIDALLVKFDMTPEGLARIAGVTKATISRWRTGSTEAIRPKTLNRICEALELEPDDIVSDQNGLAANEHGRVPDGAIKPCASEPAYAPLLGRVHAGKAQEPDVLQDAIPVPYEIIHRHPQGYFLQVEGDCMDNVYPEGCYILIDPEQRPSNGSIAVVSIDGADYVMRRLYRGANTLILSPDSHNAEHEDMVFAATTEHTVEFHGTVVWFQASKEKE